MISVATCMVELLSWRMDSRAQFVLLQAVDGPRFFFSIAFCRMHMCLCIIVAAHVFAFHVSVVLHLKTH